MKVMGNWTPGPWEWSDEYSARDLSETWSLIGADGYGILSCDGKANSPQHLNPADARLISASPDMAEALKSAADFIQRAAGLAIGADEVIAKARAALAKAGA